MFDSLQRLSALPPDTLVCAGHEYTAANGRFACTVDPHNKALQARLQEVTRRRAQGLPTLPVELASERASNPFLRVDSDAVIDWCHRHGHAANERVERFAALRAAKDAFR